MLALLALVILVALGNAYYRQQAFTTRSATLPSQKEWDASLSTSTPQLLIGKIKDFAGGTITLAVDAPQTLGTVSITVISSTSIIKTTPKSPKEMAAAFKEFQRLQKEANGKPFTAPSAVTTVPLSLSNLKAGDSVLVTLTSGSTKARFIAQKIEVVPVQ